VAVVVEEIMLATQDLMEPVELEAEEKVELPGIQEEQPLLELQTLVVAEVEVVVTAVQVPAELADQALLF
jgi:hypothetical protein